MSRLASCLCQLLQQAEAHVLPFRGRTYKIHSEGRNGFGMMQDQHGGHSNAVSQPLPDSLQHLQHSAAAAEHSHPGNQESGETSLEEGSPSGKSGLEQEHSSGTGWETASDEAEGKEHAAAAESNGASTAPRSTTATEEQTQSRSSKVGSSVVPDHTSHLVTPALLSFALCTFMASRLTT